MENLPIIVKEDGTQAVNARHLHAILGVKKDFSDWFHYNIANYGFQKDVDYAIYNKNGVKSENQLNRGAGRPNMDYILTLDTAKEMAMMSRCAKGREVRQYFIQVEKKAKQMYEALYSGAKASKQDKIEIEYFLSDKAIMDVMSLSNEADRQRMFLALKAQAKMSHSIYLKK